MSRPATANCTDGAAKRTTRLLFKALPIKGEENMLFQIGFVAVGLVLLVSGFLQFAWPTKYVDFMNWYIGKTSFGKPLSLATWSRWTHRLPGLVLFLGAIFIFYQYAAIIRRH